MSDLTKLTVHLTPRAWDSLVEAADLTGDTKTDTVNRALALYAHIVKTEVGATLSFDCRPGERRTVAVVRTEGGES